MKLTIEATNEFRTLDGCPTRMWRGKTEAGNPVTVFVAGIGSHNEAAQDELDKGLLEVPVPQIGPFRGRDVRMDPAVLG